MIMNKILELTQAELARQKSTLNLIASENYPSPKVLELLGSAWTTNTPKATQASAIMPVTAWQMI